jgi:hypothetical protein
VSGGAGTDRGQEVDTGGDIKLKTMESMEDRGCGGVGGTKVVRWLRRLQLESSKLDTCDVLSLDGSESLVGSPTALLVGERSSRVRRRRRPIRRV